MIIIRVYRILKDEYMRIVKKKILLSLKKTPGGFVGRY